MWTIRECIIFLVLIVAAVSDMKSRSISVRFLRVCAAGSILCAGYQIATGELNHWLVCTGIFVGICFLLISKLTEEAMGYGDSLMVLFLGIIVGFWDILTILAITFLLLLCVTIPVLWKKKMSRKFSLPFLPFLTGGYLCFLIMGGAYG